MGEKIIRRKRRSSRKAYLIYLFFGISTAAFFSYLGLRFFDQHHESPPWIQQTNLSEILGSEISQQNFPEKLILNVQGDSTPQEFRAQYTLDFSAQRVMQKFFERYKPDYGAFVAMEAETGKILTLVSYHNRELPNGINLAIESMYPAASIFKIVTATAVMDLNKGTPETLIAFNGSSHTLYKRNVRETIYNKWTRYVSIREAFAKSVNSVFGKLGLFHSGPEQLLNYAHLYGFNQKIEGPLRFKLGELEPVKNPTEDAWTTAQMASGYTEDTTMSPLHGAMIASAVVNQGKIMKPLLLDSLVKTDGTFAYQAQSEVFSHAIQNPQAIGEMRKLMQATVEMGTAKKAFRIRNRKRGVLSDIEVGGKTGSLTGGVPRGKCNWFVGYADGFNKKIAVAAVTIDVKTWKVKSSEIAKYFIQHYFENLNEEVALGKAPSEITSEIKAVKKSAARRVSSRPYKKVYQEQRKQKHSG